MRRHHVLLIALGALAIPVSDASAAAWLAPTSLSIGPSADYTLVPAIGPDGTVAAARDNVVWVKPAGVPLESGTSLGASSVYPPAIAVGPGGAVTVLVRRGTTTSVYRRPAGSASFLPPVDVTGVTADGGSPGAVAIDAAGTTVVAVVRSGRVEALQIAADGTQTGPAVVSAAGRTASAPGLGTGGVTVLSYVTKQAGSSTVERLEGAVAPATGGPFDAPVVIDQLTAASGQTPSINARRASVRAGGSAALAYSTALDDGVNTTATVRVATLDGGTFSASTLESATGPYGPGHLYAVADVAAHEDGSATAVWSISDAPPAALRTSTRPAGADAFGPAQNFLPSGITGNATLSSALDLGPGGTMLVTDQNGPPDTRAAIAPPFSSFGASTAIFGAAQDVGLIGGRGTAVDRRGQAAVAREDMVTGGYSLDLALYDGRAPELRAVTIPATAAAGTPVAMAATAFDALSPAGTPTWSFGDGSSADGAAVSHTYAAPGTYAVSVTTKDAAGNVSAPSTGTVFVPAASVVPPRGGGTPAVDRTAPRITKLMFTPSAGRRGRTVKASFVVGEAAKVTVRVQRVRTGRKVKGRCVVGARKGKRCKRVTTLVKRSTAAESAGTKLTVTLGSARVRLPVGKLRVLVTATDAAGNTGIAKRTLTVRR